MIPYWKLKRHPIPMMADFRHCLVVTYGFSASVLTPLLPPGLQLDTLRDVGFVAIALVQVEGMRPVGLPSQLGINCMLIGYRIFTRFQTPTGANWRGLRILRSEANNRLIQWGGNSLTHYNYHFCRAQLEEEAGTLHVKTQSADGLILDVSAKINEAATALPEASVFENFVEARRFAGPLPFTFDYEPQTHSIISIRGERPEWNPMPVEVDVHRCDFLNQAPFRDCGGVLCNAFYVKDIPYRWQRGVPFALAGESA